jgi:hypothetical protein
MAPESKIEQYLLLAKGARGRATGELIAKATSEPGLFAFGELLDLPSVQEVRFGSAALCDRCVSLASTCLEGSTHLTHTHTHTHTHIAHSSRAASTRPTSSCWSSSATAPGRSTKVREAVVGRGSP